MARRRSPGETVGERFVAMGHRAMTSANLSGPEPHASARYAYLATYFRTVRQAHQRGRDAENLCIVGSAVLPTMAGYAATPTIAALAYRTPD